MRRYDRRWTVHWKRSFELHLWCEDVLPPRIWRLTVETLDTHECLVGEKYPYLGSEHGEIFWSKFKAMRAARTAMLNACRNDQP